MTEAQIVLLIQSLAASIPSDLALYQTLVANRQGTKNVDELLADANAKADQIIAANS